MGKGRGEKCKKGKKTVEDREGKGWKEKGREGGRVEGREGRRVEEREEGG